MGDAAVGHVRSSDGTRIGYRRSGEGPPLVLVHGTTGAHWSFGYVLPELVGRFTVHALDRRGRGESGDAADYAIEREFEDVACLVDSLEQPGVVFGHSFGATVALGASLLAGNARGLVLYEGSPGIPAVDEADLERVEALVAAGEREAAMVESLRLFGLTAEEVDQMRAAPTWPVRVAAAHTIVREVRAEEAYAVEPDRFRELSVAALLLLGEESPDWAREATERLRAALPDARVAVLPGQGHAATMTAPGLVADEIVRFATEAGAWTSGDRP
ncbi:MAG TPA: alpha/beta hydrolase [Gaiellaceae bacterium]|nr:alpha/beta hydrolase [Gaiellaceae bacterium]